MENSSWDLAPATSKGVIPSFLQPLDKPVPMVAIADIGRLAAQLLQETWSGQRIVELEGPIESLPTRSQLLTRLLGRPVKVEAVPRETWESLFKSQGMKNPAPRIQMLDGFNEGWIEFAGQAGSRKGNVAMETVLRMLIERGRNLSGFSRLRVPPVRLEVAGTQQAPTPLETSWKQEEECRKCR